MVRNFAQHLRHATYALHGSRQRNSSLALISGPQNDLQRGERREREPGIGVDEQFEHGWQPRYGDQTGKLETEQAKTQ